MDNVILRVAPHQQRFLESTAKVCAIVGGRGCGKSHALGFQILKWMKEESPKSAILAMANTHDQLDKSFLLRLKSILDECGIEHTHGCRPPANWDVPLRKRFKKWDNILTLDSGHVIVTGTLDEPDNVRGGEYGLIVLDEAAFAPSNKWMKSVFPCLRCKEATKRIVRIATSPNGYNWFYDLFDGPERKPGFESIRAQAFDNPELPPDYREMFAGLSDSEYRQECLGEYVSSGEARVYTEYDPVEHDLDWEYIEGMEIHMGCDFNVSPMSWVLAQEHKGKLYVFDEVFIENNATTFDACDTVTERYPKSHIYAYPDASAKLRNTVAIKGVRSDLEAMRAAGFTCILPGKNPPIAERIERVQRRFRERRVFISSRCKNLKKSLLATVYNPGDRKPKKSKEYGEVGEHPTDALGYMIYSKDNHTSISAVPFSR